MARVRTKYICVLIASLLLSSSASAVSECDDKVFSNLSSNRGTTIAQLLEQLSSRCSFSIAIKDNGAENIVANKGLNTINLRDFTLSDVFDFLLTENGLDYEYQNGVLKISSYSTRTFKVDYITSVRSSETTFVLGSGGSNAGSTSTGGQQGIPNTAASVGSTFKASDNDAKFWETIKSDLQSILSTADGADKGSHMMSEARVQDASQDTPTITAALGGLQANQSGQTQAKNNTLIINPQAGLVTVTANKAKLKEVEEYINTVLDRLHRQVLIDVQILEVTMSNGQTTGIDWNQIYSLQNINAAYGLNLGRDFGNNKTTNTNNASSITGSTTSDSANGTTGSTTNDTTTSTTNNNTNTDNTTTTNTGAIKTDVTNIVDTTDTITPANTGTITTQTINDSKANSQTNQIITNGISNTADNTTTAVVNNGTTSSTNSATNSATNNSNGFDFAGAVTNNFTRTGTIALSGGIAIKDIIKFLKTQGSVRSISNPKLLTLNNQPALITSGDVIFYPKVSGGTAASATSGATNPTVDTVSLPVGVTLDITPEIMDENKVLLKINPTSSSCKVNNCPLQQVLVGGVLYNIAPNIAQKQISSVIKASDGDRIILGGLIQEVSNGNSSKVPGAGDIPGLGYLFKQDIDSKELRELVIIITPHIVKKEKTLSLKELGYKSDF